MKRCFRMLAVLLAAGLVWAAAEGTRRVEAEGGNIPLSMARIFIEYNSSGNDLGFHVFLDGEDWREIEIVNPKGRTIFEVEGKEAFGKLGMTELFFEGAEPSLDEIPLEDLLAKFPEGKYRFSGETVSGDGLVGTAKLTHAIPAAPDVSAEVNGNNVIIRWDPVTGPPEGFPDRKIIIEGYQVIVGSFQVTLPNSRTSVTVPPEFVESLLPGEHGFEVLAIEAGGNQTITEGSFTVE